MGEQALRALRGRPVRGAASRRSLPEWVREILGAMNGPGAGARAARGAWLRGSESHDPFSTRPTPVPPFPLRTPPPSDYIIKEKTVLLQKKDSEGFGFVLRGAKGECWPGGDGRVALQPRGVDRGGDPGPPTTSTPGCWSLSYGEASVTWV